MPIPGRKIFLIISVKFSTLFKLQSTYLEIIVRPKIFAEIMSVQVIFVVDSVVS